MVDFKFVAYTKFFIAQLDRCICYITIRKLTVPSERASHVESCRTKDILTYDGVFPTAASLCNDMHLFAFTFVPRRTEEAGPIIHNVTAVFAPLTARSPS